MSEELPPIHFVGSLLALWAIVYVYKRIENPYVKYLLLVLSVCVGAYAFLWNITWAMSGSSIAAGFPCILVFGYIIFKAVQWQIQKSKRKSEESDD